MRTIKHNAEYIGEAFDIDEKRKKELRKFVTQALSVSDAYTEFAERIINIIEDLDDYEKAFVLSIAFGLCSFTVGVRNGD